MRKYASAAGWILPLILPIAARAVIVDRIAVIVGDNVITQSEIGQRIRLTAFQNHMQPDFSLASRQAAAQELIGQKLVEHEMDLGRYPRLDADRRKALLGDYEKTEFQSNPAALAQALKGYGLTPLELETDLGRQSDLLSFLNLRFRPAVQVTDEDIDKYVDKNAAGADQLRALIGRQLTADRADKELNTWLQDQRKRTRIEFLERDLEAANK